MSIDPACRAPSPFLSFAARIHPQLGLFATANSAAAAVEFAFIFPLLLLAMIAGIQMIIYINATRKVELIANSTAQMLASAVPPANSSTATIDATTIHFTSDASMLLFPSLLKDAARQNLSWDKDILVNYASVEFTQISTNCSNPADQSACYEANVVWTTTAEGSRPCGVTLSAADDHERATPYTLPRSSFGAGALIVVDVVYVFHPIIASTFVPSVTIARTAYLPPRYASTLDFDTASNDGIVSKCT